MSRGTYTKHIMDSDDCLVLSKEREWVIGTTTGDHNGPSEGSTPPFPTQHHTDDVLTSWTWQKPQSPQRSDQDPKTEDPETSNVGA